MCCMQLLNIFNGCHVLCFYLIRLYSLFIFVPYFWLLIYNGSTEIYKYKVYPHSLTVHLLRAHKLKPPKLLVSMTTRFSTSMSKIIMFSPFTLRNLLLFLLFLSYLSSFRTVYVRNI